MIKRIFSLVLLVCFLTNSAGSTLLGASEQSMPLPKLAAPIFRETHFLMRGLNIDRDNPFQLDFLLQKVSKNENPQEEQKQLGRMMQYFINALAFDKKDMWVNLSPYERQSMVDPLFGQTPMGRELLSQDLQLKYVASMAMSPKNTSGQIMWRNIFKEVKEKFGTTDIPFNEFNKVWIIPDQVKVHEQGRKMLIASAKLKVMLDEDIIANAHQRNTGELKTFLKEKIKEFVIPVIEKEVNEGARFARLREMFFCFIVADWYKQILRPSMFGQTYFDKAKTGGLNIREVSNEIYRRYMHIVKRGVVNEVREEFNDLTGRREGRKYLIGGMRLDGGERISPNSEELSQAMSTPVRVLRTELAPKITTLVDQAQNAPEKSPQERANDLIANWTKEREFSILTLSALLDLSPSEVREFYPRILDKMTKNNKERSPEDQIRIRPEYPITTEYFQQVLRRFPRKVVMITDAKKEQLIDFEQDIFDVHRPDELRQDLLVDLAFRNNIDLEKLKSVFIVYANNKDEMFRKLIRNILEFDVTFQMDEDELANRLDDLFEELPQGLKEKIGDPETEDIAVLGNKNFDALVYLIVQKLNGDVLSKEEVENTNDIIKGSSKLQFWFDNIKIDQIFKEKLKDLNIIDDIALLKQDKDLTPEQRRQWEIGDDLSRQEAIKGQQKPEPAPNTDVIIPKPVDSEPDSKNVPSKEINQSKDDNDPFKIALDRISSRPVQFYLAVNKKNLEALRPALNDNDLGRTIIDFNKIASLYGLRNDVDDEVIIYDPDAFTPQTVAVLLFIPHFQKISKEHFHDKDPKEVMAHLRDFISSKIVPGISISGDQEYYVYFESLYQKYKIQERIEEVNKKLVNLGDPDLDNYSDGKNRALEILLRTWNSDRDGIFIRRSLEKSLRTYFLLDLNPDMVVHLISIENQRREALGKKLINYDLLNLTPWTKDSEIGKLAVKQIKPCLFLLPKDGSIPGIVTAAISKALLLRSEAREIKDLDLETININAFKFFSMLIDYLPRSIFDEIKNILLSPEVITAINKSRFSLDIETEKTFFVKYLLFQISCQFIKRDIDEQNQVLFFYNFLPKERKDALIKLLERYGILNALNDIFKKLIIYDLPLEVIKGTESISQREKRVIKEALRAWDVIEDGLVDINKIALKTSLMPGVIRQVALSEFIQEENKRRNREKALGIDRENISLGELTKSSEDQEGIKRIYFTKSNDSKSIESKVAQVEKIISDRDNSVPRKERGIIEKGVNGSANEIRIMIYKKLLREDPDYKELIKSFFEEFKAKESAIKSILFQGSENQRVEQDLESFESELLLTMVPDIGLSRSNNSQSIKFSKLLQSELERWLRIFKRMNQYRLMDLDTLPAKEEEVKFLVTMLEWDFKQDGMWSDTKLNIRARVNGVNAIDIFQRNETARYYLGEVFRDLDFVFSESFNRHDQTFHDEFRDILRAQGFFNDPVVILSDKPSDKMIEILRAIFNQRDPEARIRWKKEFRQKLLNQKFNEEYLRRWFDSDILARSRFLNLISSNDRTQGLLERVLFISLVMMQNPILRNQLDFLQNRVIPKMNVDWNRIRKIMGVSSEMNPTQLITVIFLLIKIDDEQLSSKLFEQLNDPILRRLWMLISDLTNVSTLEQEALSGSNLIYTHQDDPKDEKFNDPRFTELFEYEQMILLLGFSKEETNFNIIAEKLGWSKAQLERFWITWTVSQAIDFQNYKALIYDSQFREKLISKNRTKEVVSPNLELWRKKFGRNIYIWPTELGKIPNQNVYAIDDVQLLIRRVKTYERLRDAVGINLQWLSEIFNHPKLGPDGILTIVAQFLIGTGSLDFFLTLVDSKQKLIDLKLWDENIGEKIIYYISEMLENEHPIGALKISQKKYSFKVEQQIFLNELIRKKGWIDRLKEVINDLVVQSPTIDILKGNTTEETRKRLGLLNLIRLWNDSDGEVTLSKIKDELAKKNITDLNVDEKQLQGMVDEDNQFRKLNEPWRKAINFIETIPHEDDKGSPPHSSQELPESDKNAPSQDVLTTERLEFEAISHLLSRINPRVKVLPQSLWHELGKDDAFLLSDLTDEEVLENADKAKFYSPSIFHILTSPKSDQQLMISESAIKDGATKLFIVRSLIKMMIEANPSLKNILFKPFQDLTNKVKDPSIWWQNLIAGFFGMNGLVSIDMNWRDLVQPEERYLLTDRSFTQQIDALFQQYQFVSELKKFMRSMVFDYVGDEYILRANYTEGVLRDDIAIKLELQNELRKWEVSRDGVWELNEFARRIQIRPEILKQKMIFKLIKNENQQRINEGLGRELILYKQLTDEREQLPDVIEAFLGTLKGGVYSLDVFFGKQDLFNALLSRMPYGQERFNLPSRWKELREDEKRFVFEILLNGIGKENLRRKSLGQSDDIRLKLSRSFKGGSNEWPDWYYVPEQIQRDILKEVAKRSGVSINALSREKHIRLGEVLVNGIYFDPADLNHFYYERYHKEKEIMQLPEMRTIPYMLMMLGLVGEHQYVGDQMVLQNSNWDRIKNIAENLEVKRVYVDLDETVFWSMIWLGTDNWVRTGNAKSTKFGRQVAAHERRLIKNKMIRLVDPQFKKILNELRKNGVEVIAITARNSRTRSRVREIFKQLGIDLPVEYVGNHSADTKMKRILSLEEKNDGYDRVMYIDNDKRSVLEARRIAKNLSDVSPRENQRHVTPTGRVVKLKNTAEVYSIFMEDNRHPDFKNPAYYLKNYHDAIDRGSFEEASEYLLTYLQLIYLSNKTNQEIIDGLLLVMGSIRMNVKNFPEREMEFISSDILTLMGQVLYEESETKLNDQIVEPFFDIFFPLNSRSMLEAYQQGRLIVRREQNKIGEKKYFFEVNEKNLEDFLEPIIKGIIDEKPQDIIFIDSGARPLLWSIESMLKELGVAPKLHLIPLSVKTKSDSPKSLRHLFQMAQQYQAGLINNSDLNEEDLTSVKQFIPLLNIGNKVMIIDDNIVSGDTMAILKDVLYERGVNQVLGGAIWNYRDDYIKKNEVRTSYQVLGQHNWWRKIPLDIKTVWESDLTLRGLNRERKNLSRDEIRQFARYKQFKEEIQRRARQKVSKLTRGDVPTWPVLSQFIPPSETIDNLYQKQNFKFLKIGDFSLENGWSFEQVKTLDQLKILKSRPKARAEDVLFDELLHPDLAVYLIKDSSGQVIGSMEVLLLNSRQQTTRKNLLINYLDIDYEAVSQPKSNEEWVKTFNEIVYGVKKLSDKNNNLDMVLLPYTNWEFTSRPDIAAVLRSMSPESPMLYEDQVLVFVENLKRNLYSRLIKNDDIAYVKRLLSHLKILPNLALNREFMEHFNQGLKDIEDGVLPLSGWINLLRFRFPTLTHQMFLVVSRNPNYIKEFQEQNRRQYEDFLTLKPIYLFDDNEREILKSVQMNWDLGLRISQGQRLALKRFMLRQRFFEERYRPLNKWQKLFTSYPQDFNRWSQEQKWEYQVIEFLYRRLEADLDPDWPVSRYPIGFFENEAGAVRAKFLLQHLMRHLYPVHDLRKLRIAYFYDHGVGLAWKLAYQEDIFKLAQEIYPGEYEAFLDEKGQLIPKKLQEDELERILNGGLDIVAGRSLETDTRIVTAYEDINHGILIRDERKSDQRVIIWGKKPGQPYTPVHPFFMDIKALISKGKVLERPIEDPYRRHSGQWDKDRFIFNAEGIPGADLELKLDPNELKGLNIPANAPVTAVFHTIKTKQKVLVPVVSIFLKDPKRELELGAHLGYFGNWEGEWQWIKRNRINFNQFLLGEIVFDIDSSEIEIAIKKHGDKWVAPFKNNFFYIDSSNINNLKEGDIVRLIMVDDADYGPIVKMFRYESLIGIYMMTKNQDLQGQPGNLDILRLIDFANSRKNSTGMFITPPTELEFNSTKNPDQNGIVVNAFGKSMFIELPDDLIGQRLVFKSRFDRTRNQWVFDVFKDGEESLYGFPDAILGRDEVNGGLILLPNEITNLERKIFDSIVDGSQLKEMITLAGGIWHPALLDYITKYLKDQYPDIFKKIDEKKLPSIFVDWLDRYQDIKKRDSNRIKPATGGKSGNKVVIENLLTASEAKVECLVEIYRDTYYSQFNEDAQRTINLLKQLYDHWEDPVKKAAILRVREFFISIQQLKIRGVRLNGNADSKIFMNHQRAFVKVALDLLEKNKKVGKDGLGILNADGMGLGKTVENLTLLLNLPQVNKHRPNRYLIIAPKSILEVWKREIQEWAKDNHLIYEVDGFSGESRMTYKEIVNQPTHLRDIESQQLSTNEAFILMTSESLRGAGSKLVLKVNEWLEKNGYEKIKFNVGQLFHLSKEESVQKILDLFKNKISLDKIEELRLLVSTEIDKNLGTFFAAKELKPDGMVLDEGHRIRNAATKQALAIAAFSQVPYRILSTGTPLRGQYMIKNFTNLLFWLDPDMFNKSYMKQFDDTPVGQWTFGLSLRKSIMVRRTVDLVLKGTLKEAFINEVKLDLPESEREEYDFILEQFNEWVSRIKLSKTRVTENMILARLSRLIQYVSGIRFKQSEPVKANIFSSEDLKWLTENNIVEIQENEVDGREVVLLDFDDENEEDVQKNISQGGFKVLKKMLSSVYFETDPIKNPKLKALNEIINQNRQEAALDNIEKPIVIFSQWKIVVSGLRDYYQKQGLRVDILTGQENKEKRNEVVRKFQHGELDLIILTDAGEEGITLTRSNISINYSLGWDLADQRNARVHRLGQKLAVRIYNFLINNTIEEYMSLVRKVKEESQKRVVDGVPPAHRSDLVGRIVEEKFGGLSQAMISNFGENKVDRRPENATRGGIDWTKMTMNRSTDSSLDPDLQRQIKEIEDQIEGLTYRMHWKTGFIPAQALFAAP